MEFYEHTLLSYPDLILTILKVTEHGEASLQDCLAVLLRKLTQAEERPTVTPQEVLRHLDHAARNLLRARLLAPAEGGRLLITDRGRKALAEHPMGIDDTVLMEFPEFRDYVAQLGEAASAKALWPSVYDQGYLAFRRGRGLAENPHAFETAEHLAWENGWFQARDEEAERTRS